MFEGKSINDAMVHINNIEGYPNDVNPKKLPKPIRYFGYFFIAFFSITVPFIIIAIILT